MRDIDIDFADREKILNLIPHIRASREHDGELIKHNTGIYLQKTPFDILKNLCKITYNDKNNNYFKIDFLNFNLYKDIRDEDHLNMLMNKEPFWDLLEQEEFVNLLYHINGHGKLLKMMRPSSIEELAAILAIIRPSKKHLAGKSWKEILSTVWDTPENDEYYFKKPHAVAYAVAIVVQMNLLCESLLSNS